MNEQPIDWAARKQRARDYLVAWRQERDEAIKQRRPMKYVPYRYEDSPAIPAGAQEEGRGSD